MGNKLRALAIVLALGVASCAGGQSASQPAGARDGSSIEKAIILEGVTNEIDGVRAEHSEIKKRFPGWHLEMQHLVSGPDGRPYDVMTISNGSATKDVYFDITDWFGKL